MIAHLVRGCSRCFSNCTIHSQHTRPRAEIWRSIVHARLPSSFIARGGISELTACSDRASYSRRSFSKDGTSVERAPGSGTPIGPPGPRLDGESQVKILLTGESTSAPPGTDSRARRRRPSCRRTLRSCRSTVWALTWQREDAIRFEASAKPDGWTSANIGERDGCLRTRLRSARHWTYRTIDVVMPELDDRVNNYTDRDACVQLCLFSDAGLPSSSNTGPRLIGEEYWRGRSAEIERVQIGASVVVDVVDTSSRFSLERIVDGRIGERNRSPSTFSD